MIHRRRRRCSSSTNLICLTATTMIEAFTINVGGRSFTTLKSTLERSPFLATMLSSNWAGSTCCVNGTVFVDRSPFLFEHILDFLRSSAPPIFWTRTNGFDLPLYASLLREAEYFQLEALGTWIRNKQYINAIWITASIEVVPLRDCIDGTSHFGDIEKEFEPGDFSKAGKSTTVYKRLLLQKTQLRLPVSGNFLVLCVSRLTHTLIGHTLIGRQPAARTRLSSSCWVQHAFTSALCQAVRSLIRRVKVLNQAN